MALVACQSGLEPGGLRRKQKLVEIDKGDPSRFVGEMLRAVAIGGQLPRVLGPVRQRDKTASGEGGDDLARAVRAAVVIEIDVLHADAEMEGQPFAEHGGLVAENGADRKVTMS